MAEEKVEITKKPYSKEKIGVTVMLVGLTAAIFLAIGYWAGTQSAELEDQADITVVEKSETATVASSPTSTATTSATDETADWKTYTNDEYGFSFKYPEDWQVRDLTSFQVEAENLKLLLGASPQGVNYDSNYTIRITTNSIDESIAEREGENSTIVSDKLIEKYGKEIRAVTAKNKTTNLEYTSYYTTLDGDTVVLSGPSDGTDKQTETANTMVDTFEFVK